MQKKEFYKDHCMMIDATQKKVKVPLKPCSISNFNRRIFDDGSNNVSLTKRRIADCIWKANYVDVEAPEISTKTDSQITFFVITL